MEFNTPDDDVFSQFVESQKEKAEREAASRGGGGEYKGEQVKYCAAPDNGHIIVRFVGAPPEAGSYKAGDAILRCISEIKDDNGKRMYLILPTRAETLEEDHFMWRLISKVMEKEWVQKKRIYVNQINHPRAFEIVNKGGFKPEDGNKYTYSKGWNAPEVLLVNCIDRMDSWCQENKHTKVFSKNIWISENGSEFPDIGVKSNGFLTKLIDNMGKYGSWWKYDSYIVRESDKEKRKKEPFSIVNGSGFKAANMVVELKGITPSELALISTSQDLTDEEKTYKAYDLKDNFRVSSYTKLYTRLGKQIKAIDADLGTRFYDELKLLADQEKKEREIAKEAKKDLEKQDNQIKETLVNEPNSFESVVETTVEVNTVPKREIQNEIFSGLTDDKIALLNGWEGLKDSEKAMIKDVVLENGEFNTIIYSEDCGNLYPCPKDQGGCGTLSPESYSSCPRCGKRWG